MYDHVIYLDNCATTKLLPESAETLNLYCTQKYFNPSAIYNGAVDVFRDIIAARKIIAECLGCSDQEVFFTSGGSESNNTAIFGSVKGKKGRIIASAGEHMSVYAPFSELKNRGFDVRFAKIDKTGRVDIDHFKSLLTEDTVFVSVIHASNETGAVNDIGLISRLCKEANPNCIVHADGTQAYLKMEFDLDSSGVDLYTISGHKVHAPKGVGALYIRKGLKINPLIYGGAQEFGMRAGTENTGAICAFATASKILHGDMGWLIKKYESLRKTFLQSLSEKIEDFSVNCEDGLPNIISLSFPGIKSQVLITMLSERGVYIASGSACSSRQRNSRVLKEMGLPQNNIEGAVRVSFGYFNTYEDVYRAAETIAYTVKELREKINP